MATRPLLLGPDAEGFTLIVAGDRVCWYGAGPRPKMPGAATVPCPGARLKPGRVRGGVLRVEGGSDGEGLRSMVRDFATQGLGAGVTALVLLVSGPEIDAEHLQAAGAAVRRAGLRAVIGAAASTREQGLEGARRALDAGRCFILANQDPLLRGAVGIDGAEPRDGDLWPEARELAAELGTAVAVGPAGWSEAMATAFLAARFGRRCGAFDPGAAADAVAIHGAQIVHAVIGGQLVLRDGQAIEPPRRWRRPPGARR